MELKGTTETFVQEIWTVALSAIGVIRGIPRWQKLGGQNF